MPKYDLAGNPLPEPGGAPPPAPPQGAGMNRAALPPRYDAQGRPIHAAPPPSAAPTQYDLAGNPIPQSAPPPPPPGGWVPPTNPQPGTWPPPSSVPGGYGNPFGMPQARNTSGEQGDVPPEIARLKWSWGAAVLPQFWGFKHGAAIISMAFWIAYFVSPGMRMVVPASQYQVVSTLYQICMLAAQIYLGLNGNKMAWRNRHYPGGIPEFFQVQRAWMGWGIGIFLLIDLPVMAIGTMMLLHLGPFANFNMAGSHPYGTGYGQPYGNGFGGGGNAGGGGQ